jgi:hypothetical protein
MCVEHGEGEMPQRTHFVIFKSASDSWYSITECSSSGVRQAFMNNGNILGDRNVLYKLSQIKPKNESIESYVEKNAGHLIYGRC